MIYPSLREVKMQKFSYHTHTNSFGLFDGRNTVEEMIEGAYKAGYTELGISNHLIYHPNMHISSEAQKNDKMFHADKQKAKDIMTGVAQDIREKAKKAPIKVYVGFEVDFFPSKKWRDDFEDIISEAKPDYLIGSTHFMRTPDESLVLNLYHLKESNCPESEKDKLMVCYWENIIESIKSGYFDFIAHLDVCKLFGLGIEPKWDELKRKVIDTLDKYHHPYELNTSGWRKIGEQHPHLWMIEELNKRDVPIIISDDAHKVEHIAGDFEKAEELLASINYKNRYKPNLKL